MKGKREPNFSEEETLFLLRFVRDLSKTLNTLLPLFFGNLSRPISNGNSTGLF